MIAILRLTFREWVNRKMGLVMMVLTITLPVLLILQSRIHRNASGGFGADTAMKAQTAFEITLNLSAAIWSLISAISASTLFSSFLERGWADLLLTKAQKRWMFLLTRFVATVALYAVSIVGMLSIIALYFVQAGSDVIPPGLWRSVLLLTVSFSAMAATAMLLSLTRSGIALPIIGVLLETLFSGILSQHRSLEAMFNSAITRKVIEVAYWVVPKHTELARMSRSFAEAGSSLNSAPIWTTLAFTVVLIVASLIWIQRKAF
jgi:ABC-type transport system involved in multi-copper enzyme maturation permease subunit